MVTMVLGVVIIGGGSCMWMFCRSRMSWDSFAEHLHCGEVRMHGNNHVGISFCMGTLLLVVALTLFHHLVWLCIISILCIHVIRSLWMTGRLHIAKRCGQVSLCCVCGGQSVQNGVGNLVGQNRCFLWFPMY